ncbi:MAG: condensation domain-containing protein, partial [Parvularculaceae bacterium]
SGPLDEAKFLAAAEASLNAQEAFRLRFATDGSLQTSDAAAVLRVDRLDLSMLDPARQAEDLNNLRELGAREPFDLARGPMVRARIVKLDDAQHLFLIYAHHIVFDGYSAELLIKDIAARYASAAGAEIEPYSAYVAKSTASLDRRAAQTYWRELLDAPPPPLDLPTDRPYPARRRFEGSTARGRIPTEVAAAVKSAGRTAGVGAFAMFLSAYAALMARLTGQEDFIVGVPAAGQANLGVETVGYCVNMLPMRMKPALSHPFIDFARATQQGLIEAMEHQDLSLSDLARDLKSPRDLSRPALIQNVFNYSAYFDDIKFGACTARASENRRAAVHHELFANLTESEAGLAADWDFSTAIFDEATIESWIVHLSALLADIALRPTAPIGQLSLMSKEARDAVVVSMRRG